MEHITRIFAIYPIVMYHFAFSGRFLSGHIHSTKYVPTSSTVFVCLEICVAFEQPTYCARSNWSSIDWRKVLTITFSTAAAAAVADGDDPNNKQFDRNKKQKQKKILSASNIPSKYRQYALAHIMYTINIYHSICYRWYLFWFDFVTRIFAMVHGPSACMSILNSIYLSSGHWRALFLLSTLIRRRDQPATSMVIYRLFFHLHLNLVAYEASVMRMVRIGGTRCPMHPNNLCHIRMSDKRGNRFRQ